MEKTFVAIKPTGIQRNLVGEIIKRIEQKGLKILALKIIQVTEEQANKHYDIHKGKPFFNKLISAITSSPMIVMVVSGNEAVKIMRLLAGETDPTKSQPGTIRGDFSADLSYNVIHTADSVDRAKYEISIYFDEKEIIDYQKDIDKHVNSNN